jgi:hypothetical protein
MAIELKLSDADVGTPRSPTRWSNEQQESIPLDPCEVFLDRLHDRKTTDWKTQRTEQTLFLRHTAIATDADIYHRNYLEYLEKCWGDHLGIVITPDILWFTVLGELVSVVKQSPEPYRHLFTDSHEKKTITVKTEDPVVMPLNRLVGALRDEVPTDSTLFMPEYSTTTQAARHAMYASFCDLCSPYYDYMMLACAFPAISVQGDADDWCALGANWLRLKPLFASAGQWFDDVATTLMSCYENLNERDWWQSMFMLERCGSGSQTEVSGWFADLYREGPSGPRYVKNFPTSVAAVDYKELMANREFKMQDGLFFSRQEGDFMVPEFGYTVHEKLDPVVTEKGEGALPEIQVMKIENTGTRTLAADFKVEVGEPVIAYNALDAETELKNDEDSEE